MPLEATQRPDDRQARCARALHARRRAPSCTQGREPRKEAACPSFPSGRHGDATTPPTTPRTATAPLLESSHRRGDHTVLQCMGRIVDHVVGHVNYFFMKYITRWSIRWGSGSCQPTGSISVQVGSATGCVEVNAVATRPSAVVSKHWRAWAISTGNCVYT